MSIPPKPGFSLRDSDSKTGNQLESSEIDWLKISRLVDSLNANRDSYPGRHPPDASSDRPPETSHSPPQIEIQHLAFLKVHKAASSTVQNIIYRFGLKRNLSFVLPENNHYISKSKKSPNKLLPHFPYYISNTLNKQNNSEEKYDILCNHAIFNHNLFKAWLHNDSVYIAIVREPLSLFLSSAYYYRLVWPNTYLEELDEGTFIDKLIKDPETYEAKNINKSKTFNTMSQDFGFEFTSAKHAKNISDIDFEKFVGGLGHVFDFVLIVEMFDESLIMLKRRLHWKFQDILYVKRNSLESSVNMKNLTMPAVTANDKRVFRQRNRFDYMIYEFFISRFQENLSKEHRLDDELSAFKGVLKTVQEFCNGGAGEVTVTRTDWSEEFFVTRNDCDLMQTDEIPLWKLVKKRHMVLLHG